MMDLIMIAILTVIIAMAVRYLYKAKKNGAVCVGCPAGCSCSRQKSSAPDSTGLCGCCKETE